MSARVPLSETTYAFQDRNPISITENDWKLILKQMPTMEDIEMSFKPSPPTSSSPSKRPSLADKKRQKKARKKARSTNGASVVQASAVPVASTAADVLKAYEVPWEPWMAYASLTDIELHAQFFQNLDSRERSYEVKANEWRMEYTQNYLNSCVK